MKADATMKRRRNLAAAPASIFLASFHHHFGSVICFPVIRIRGHHPGSSSKTKLYALDGSAVSQLQNENVTSVDNLKNPQASTDPDTKICLLLGTAEDEDPSSFHLAGQEIADSLGIPCIDSLSTCSTSDTMNVQHALTLEPVSYERDPDDIGVTYALSIQSLQPPQSSSSKNRKNKKPLKKVKLQGKPFYVDFCPSANSKAGKRGSQQSGTDLLVKAVGPKRGSTIEEGAVIYDLTAGLGQDSLVLALNGASKVVMVEKDPIVHALLHDALRRLRMIASFDDKAKLLASIMSLQKGDGGNVAAKLSTKALEERPDIIYLDPMFPPRTKSAAVKKGMQLLHGLLSTQDPSSGDESSQREVDIKQAILLQHSLAAAKVKVVVKRPIKATALGYIDKSIPKPSYSVDGSVNRWDVYLCECD